MAKRVRSLVYVFVYIAAYFAAQVAALSLRPLSDTVICYINGMKSFSELWEYFLNELSFQDRNSMFVLVMAMIISVLLMWAVIAVRRIKLKTYFKIGRVTAAEVVAAPLYAYGLSVVAFIIVSLPQLSGFLSEYAQSIGAAARGDALTSLVTVCLLAPVFEEFIFRGIILGELSKNWSFIAANIIQAVIFGAMHLNVIQGLYAALIGVVLGMIYRRSKNLALPMMVHVCFNAINMFSGVYLASAGLEIYFLVGGAVALAAAFLLTGRKK